MSKFKVSQKLIDESLSTSDEEWFSRLGELASRPIQSIA